MLRSGTAQCPLGGWATTGGGKGRGGVAILVVEDEEGIVSFVRRGLESAGHRVLVASDGIDGLTMALSPDVELVVLDLGLPGIPGEEVLRRLRSRRPSVPVIVLTAKDAVSDRVANLDAGADDYMVKPFDLRELAARLHAVVRRAQGRAVQAIEAGPLRLEPESGQAWLDGEPVSLSRRERDLLVHLADARGRWLGADALHERLYGLEVEIGSNALNVHIHNIRRKLGPDAIQTSRGLGYRLGWRPA